MFNKAQIVVNEPTGDGSVSNLVILFTGDSGEKREEHFLITNREAANLTFITNLSRSKVKDLNQSFGKPISPKTVLDLSDEVLSQEEIDKEKYLSDRHKLERLVLFHLTPEQAQCDAFEVELEKRYKPEYFDDL